MPKQKRLAVSCMAVAILATMLIASHLMRPMRAAGPEKRLRAVKRLPIEKNEPVSILKVKVKNNPVSKRQKFSADEDWLSGLKIHLRNRSTKRILFASIQLQFSRPLGSTGPIAIDDIDYGDRSLLWRAPGSANGGSSLDPNREFDVEVTQASHSSLRYLLTQTGYPASVDEVSLRIAKVIFADDTMWYAGSFFQRDPSNPSAWINAAAISENGKQRSLQPQDIQMPRTTSELSSPGRPFDTLAQPNSLVSQLLFTRAAYTPLASLQSCKTLFSSSVHECGTPYNGCNYPYDMLGSSSGDYYLAAASALCKQGEQSCNHWQSTNIANSCGFGGGGGGGGGEGTCGSEFDCSWDEDCCNGSCQEHTNFGCLEW